MLYVYISITTTIRMQRDAPHSPFCNLFFSFFIKEKAFADLLLLELHPYSMIEG